MTRTLTLLATLGGLGACTTAPTGPTLPDCDARATLTNTDFVGGLVLEPGTCWMVEERLYLDDGTVTVESGVSIHFATGAALDVASGGTLRLAGTEDAAIELGSTDPAVSWTGIRLQDSQGSDNVWEHVVIHNAGGDAWNGAAYSDAAVFLDGSSTLSADALYIRDSRGHGLLARTADLTVSLTGSTFEGNDVPAYLHPEVADALHADTAFIDNTHPHVRVVFGNNDTVTSDRTWPALAVPYQVEDRFYVEGTLTLAPGAEVQFVQGASLRVQPNAELVARGTATDPVMLHGAEALSGYWQGISVEGAAFLDHAEVANAGSTAWSGRPDSVAALYLQAENRVEITNTTVRDNDGFGVWASIDAQLDAFDANTLSGNGAPMFLHPDRAGELAGTSTISGNVDDRIHLVFGNNDVVSTDASWPSLGVPYYAADRFYVDAALTLEAGVTVEFAQDIGMIVEEGGSLAAAGTSAAPVGLVGATADVDGFWKGVQVLSDTTANDLSNAFITDAGSSTWSGDPESAAALYLGDGASIVLESVEIGPGGGYGIFFAGSDSSADCTGVTFTSLDGAAFDDDADTVLAGC